MITLKKTEYRNLGYIWGPKNSQFENSWLQFADDAVILSNSSQNTQLLLNIFVSWTQWAQMQIRLDKINVKRLEWPNDATRLCKFFPAVYIAHAAIPAIPHRGLIHLSRQNIQLLYETRRSERALQTKLRSLLDVTNSLQISVQTKLKILKEYITSQISFELKTYSFSKTWIEKELDSTADTLKIG